MKNDRLLMPVDEAYASSFGLAMLCFARLEAMAVYCHDALVPGSMFQASSKTAGRIASEFLQCAATHHDDALQPQLVAAAATFKELVEIRNSLCHSHPAMTADRQQQLYRRGEFITIEEVDDAADSFAACELILNNLFYGHLKPLEPRPPPKI